MRLFFLQGCVRNPALSSYLIDNPGVCDILVSSMHK